MTNDSVPGFTGRRLKPGEKVPTAPWEVDDADLDDDELADRMLADEERGCSDPQCEGC